MKLYSPKVIQGESAKLTRPYHGPYTVVDSKLDHKVYFLKDTEGIPLRYGVSVTCLAEWHSRDELMKSLEPEGFSSEDEESLLHEREEVDETSNDPSLVSNYLTPWDHPDAEFIPEESESETASTVEEDHDGLENMQVDNSVVPENIQMNEPAVPILNNIVEEVEERLVRKTKKSIPTLVEKISPHFGQANKKRIVYRPVMNRSQNTRAAQRGSEKVRY